MNRSQRLICALASLCILVSSPFSSIVAQGNGQRIFGATGQWATVTPMPAEKMGHCAASYNGVVYLFNGSNSAGTSNDIYKYNMAGDSWTTETNASLTDRIYGTAEQVDGIMYLIGGYAQLAPFILNTAVISYDPATGSVNYKTPMPTPVAGCASVVIGKKIYVLGGSASVGWNTDPKNLVQIYDPATDTWMSGTFMPMDARSIGATVIGNTIYMVGGYGKSATVYKTAYKGIVSDTAIVWTKLPDYPAGVINKHCVGTNGVKVFVTGGQYSAAVDSTYAFDPATSAWQRLQPKPTAVHSAARMMFDGTSRMFVFGGRTTADIVNVSEALMTVSSPIMEVVAKPIVSKVQAGKSRKYSFEISNTGSANLTWNAVVEPTEMTASVTVSQASGTLAPDVSASVALRINASSLTAGSYSASVKITGNDASHPSVSIPVSVQVVSDPITDKVVLLEEYTGTWCGWCPYGADSVHAVMQQFPDRVAAIAYHYGDDLQIIADADLLKSQGGYFGVSSFPTACVDRALFPDQTELPINRDIWGSSAAAQLANKPSPVTISLSEKQYNRTTKSTSVKVTLKFTADVAPPIRLNIVEVENGLNYGQDKYSWPIPYLYPYYHQHVARLMIPDIPGEVVSESSPMASGSTWSKTFTFISMDSLPDNAELITFVHQGNPVTQGEVLQANVEELLAQAAVATDRPEAPANYALGQNYPNPFNPGTTISYSVPVTGFVRIRVFDILGKQVATLVNERKEAGVYTLNWNASGMHSGMYYYKLESNGVTLTKNMTLLK
jgi:N-acetylneuraminic acid mutarotase/thiol-disulfide isomerase/thioredoxin